jgi:hypothetical protein
MRSPFLCSLKGVMAVAAHRAVNDEFGDEMFSIGCQITPLSSATVFHRPIDAAVLLVLTEYYQGLPE